MRIAYLALIELDVANACVVHTREISEQFGELGHEVTLILPQPLRMQRWAGVNHVWIRWWGFDRLRQLAFFAASAWHLFRLHSRRPFDVLYVREAVRQPFLPQLARWLRLPLFVEVNGWVLDDLRSLGASEHQLRMALRSQRRLLQAATGIVVSTVGNAVKIATHYAIPSNRILVQELGTNPEHFRPGDQTRVRQTLGLPLDKRIILFAGSFHHGQDIPTLVDAVAQLVADDDRALLVLAGQGAQWRLIQDRVEAAGLTDHVMMLDSCPYERIALYYQAADIAVLPLTVANIRQRNGCIALKLWDYMASGLPVVVTDLPDTPSYTLLKGKVSVVPPENRHAMAAALRELLHKPDACARLASAGLEYVRTYRTWKYAAEETERFLQKRLAEGVDHAGGMGPRA